MSRLVCILMVLTYTFTVVHLYELRTEQEIEAEANFIRAHTGCECDGETQCSYAAGIYNVSCYTSNEAYYSCKLSQCKVELCPSDQIFMPGSQTCRSCPSGLTPRWSGTSAYCDCPIGTRYDYKDGASTCVPCSGLESEDLLSYCYCLGLALDERTNECRKCPNNTIHGIGYCMCTDPRMFWSDAEFSCKECPGILVPWEHGKPRGLEGDYECRCEEENKVFNKRTGTCVSCPPDAVFDTNEGTFHSCRCLDESKYFSRLTNLCL